MPVVNESFWTIVLDGIQVGGQNIPISATQAAVDSGTTIIAMTNADARAINAVSHHGCLIHEAILLKISSPVHSSCCHCADQVAVHVPECHEKAYSSSWGDVAHVQLALFMQGQARAPCLLDAMQRHKKHFCS